MVDSPGVLRFPISPSETAPFGKTITFILIFLNFHRSSNLVSNPQATLILFPSITEVFLFRTVINIDIFILLVLGNKISGLLGKIFLIRFYSSEPVYLLPLFFFGILNFGFDIFNVVAITVILNIIIYDSSILSHNSASEFKLPNTQYSIPLMASS